MVRRSEESFQAAERIKAYVRERLREPITAADIAKAAGYSEYPFLRVFK